MFEVAINEDDLLVTVAEFEEDISGDPWVVADVSRHYTKQAGTETFPFYSVIGPVAYVQIAQEIKPHFTLLPSTIGTTFADVIRCEVFSNEGIHIKFHHNVFTAFLHIGMQ